MHEITDPELDCGVPVWCHHGCDRMKVVLADPANRTVLIESAAASVHISACETPTMDRWFVDWKVGKRGDEWASGRLIFSTPELSAAFGLCMNLVRGSTSWLLEEPYYAQVAMQGHFIRWGSYLNLPCPGTGRDGDPNVSIKLNREITEAVRGLVRLQP